MGRKGDGKGRGTGAVLFCMIVVGKGAGDEHAACGCSFVMGMMMIYCKCVLCQVNQIGHETEL